MLPGQIHQPLQGGPIADGIIAQVQGGQVRRVLEACEVRDCPFVGDQVPGLGHVGGCGVGDVQPGLDGSLEAGIAEGRGLTCHGRRGGKQDQ